MCVCVCECVDQCVCVCVSVLTSVCVCVCVCECVDQRCVVCVAVNFEPSERSLCLWLCVVSTLTSVFMVMLTSQQRVSNNCCHDECLVKC